MIERSLIPTLSKVCVFFFLFLWFSYCMLLNLRAILPKRTSLDFSPKRHLMILNRVCKKPKNICSTFITRHWISKAGKCTYFCCSWIFLWYSLRARQLPAAVLFLFLFFLPRRPEITLYCTSLAALTSFNCKVFSCMSFPSSDDDNNDNDDTFFLIQRFNFFLSQTTLCKWTIFSEIKKL